MLKKRMRIHNYDGVSMGQAIMHWDAERGRWFMPLVNGRLPAYIEMCEWWANLTPQEKAKKYVNGENAKVDEEAMLPSPRRISRYSNHMAKLQTSLDALHQKVDRLLANSGGRAQGMGSFSLTQVERIDARPQRLLSEDAMKTYDEALAQPAKPHIVEGD